MLHIASFLTVILLSAPSIFAANDTAQTWQPLSTQTSSAEATAALAVDPQNTNNLYSIYNAVKTPTPPPQGVFRFGGQNAQVSFSGPQGAFAGLDQVNVLVPPSLAGSGSVNIVLTASGQTANTVNISVQ